jgi:integrase
MSNFTPYLIRRGNILFFRISVPQDLRSHLGLREITKTLGTPSKQKASPIALSLAAQAKQLFNKLRENMGTDKPSDEFISVGLIYKLELSEFGLLKNLEITTETHDKEGEAESLLQTTLDRFSQSNSSLNEQTSILSTQSKLEALPKDSDNTKLKAVIESFLDKYKAKNKSAMLKKHQAVLDMLLKVVGDKLISEIKQADINDFFELLGRLPPRWADACKKDNLSILELSELEHAETIGPKTFKSTYLASVRYFLKAARKDWQDRGFPLSLTIEGIEYTGDREEGENKQRAFKPDELKRLFEGPEFTAFANIPNQAHCYWLPLVGLFTGARVNEICQLNPQVDIFHDSESDSWCFNIDKNSEADPRIKKSVKSGESRKIPIHSKLIELGFIDYFKHVKSLGAKLLFPEWQPINKRASGNAEKWFRKLLRDANLRDETENACILGMHAFRHTLLTYGAMQEPKLFLMCITGHEQNEVVNQVTGAAKGYFTLSLLGSLQDKASLLNQLDYKLNFPPSKHL